MTSFEESGWEVFDVPDLDPWIERALGETRTLLADPSVRAAWLRHGATWFAGVNILPNDAQGALPGGPALPGCIQQRAERRHGALPEWDAGQVSIVYPGYPQRDADETEAAHRFRRNRDAAHVDGLLPVGPDRRRKMQEPHGFVLGIPLSDCDDGASPMVIWEGSHHVMRAAFRTALRDVPIEEWSETDLTDIYQAARRDCFERCRRKKVLARPGQAYILHRLALHGVAPWKEHAIAPKDGRIIVYFRPAFTPSCRAANWLDAP